MFIQIGENKLINLDHIVSVEKHEYSKNWDGALGSPGDIILHIITTVWDGSGRAYAHKINWTKNLEQCEIIWEAIGDWIG